MRQTRVEISLGDEPIDGVMCGPERMGPSMPGVVVCHPHPLLGGTADHPVVVGICRELAERGIASLRFSFRVSSHDHEKLSESAAADVVTCVEAVRMWDFVNPRRVGVAGHSFGAASILRALPELDGQVRAVSLIAPPVNAVAASDIGGYEIPRQVVVGSRDKLVRPDALRAAVAAKDESIAFEVIEGADHNFSYAADAAAKVSAGFLDKCLQ